MQNIAYSGISRRQFIAGLAAAALATPLAMHAMSTPLPALAADNFRTVDQIKESGKIIIGVFSDKAPFGYVDADGVYQGYDVEFARRLAEDLGVEVEFVATDPANRVPFLESNKVDIILANFTVTPERAEKVDFALPYMKVQLGVVSPNDALITDIEQLKANGVQLIIAKGTTAETYFEKNYPEIKLQKYDAYADAYNALMDGRGAAFSTDNTEVLAWAMSVPGFTVGIDAIGDIDTIAPAVAKGNETLLKFINDEIEALADEQFFHADYEKTLRPVYGPEADAEALVVEGGKLEAAAAGGFKDGVYEATGKGIGGKVPLTVTIEGGKIVSVEVGANGETMGIGSMAIEKLPALIVEAQGIEGVDGVSGASVTSKAIFTAMADILEQAKA
ncbi:MAG: transporter substrate-binding domain-containing protein [Coriobacteriales bacterium]|nr:transporter substrate-binding domain-containing protein [Coriobacteriales bacterium]